MQSRWGANISISSAKLKMFFCYTHDVSWKHSAVLHNTMIWNDLLLFSDRCDTETLLGNVEEAMKRAGNSGSLPSWALRIAALGSFTPVSRCQSFISKWRMLQFYNFQLYQRNGWWPLVISPQFGSNKFSKPIARQWWFVINS